MSKKSRNKKPRYDHIEKLYRSFTTKDMTLEEFRRAYEKETDPTRTRRELTQMVEDLDKRRTQSLVAVHQRKEIDKRIAEG